MTARQNNEVQPYSVRNARGPQMAQRDRLLMIELDQDDRTVDAVAGRRREPHKMAR